MNGYIQITLPEGEKVGLKFAYPAIKWFLEAMEKSGEFYYTTQQDGEPCITIEGIARLMQCGYKNNCFLKDTEPVFTFETFYNLAELSLTNEEHAKQIADVLTCYAETEYAKKVQQIADEKKSLMETLLAGTT